MAFLLSGGNRRRRRHEDVIPLNTVYKILLAQLGLSAVLAAVAWAWLGVVAGYSLVTGGLICVLPNGFLALRMLMVDARKEPERAMRAVWVGEIGKLGLTAVFFGLAFVLVEPLRVGLLFTGFIAAQMVVWAALIVDTKVNRKGSRE